MQIRFSSLCLAESASSEKNGAFSGSWEDVFVLCSVLPALSTPVLAGMQREFAKRVASSIRSAGAAYTLALLELCCGDAGVGSSPGNQATAVYTVCLQ